MILLVLAAAAAQPQAASARAFLERTYASYRNPRFNPLDHPDRYFAPAADRGDARRCAPGSRRGRLRRR
jgi:hypothetical protein